ncbi:unnamed protein product [Candidula unifasciata]|uniref:Uncharacterized protein n=1 Tax=Candidula unifasciata TaxID=100452 RepID=A0A8S4A353_9EUPU|nr:unnamed protein product [Candidula unifasciata]
MSILSNKIEKDNSENLECSTACGYLYQTLISETDKVIETSSHQRLPLNSSSRYCCTERHPEDSLSVGASQNMLAEDDQSSVTYQFQQLSEDPLSDPCLQHSNPEGQHELAQISQGFNNSSQSSICNSVHKSEISSDNSNIFISENF